MWDNFTNWKVSTRLGVTVTVHVAPGSVFSSGLQGQRPRFC